MNKHSQLEGWDRVEIEDLVQAALLVGVQVMVRIGI